MSTPKKPVEVGLLPLSSKFKLAGKIYRVMGRVTEPEPPEIELVEIEEQFLFNGTIIGKGERQAILNANPSAAITKYVPVAPPREAQPACGNIEVHELGKRYIKAGGGRTKTIEIGVAVIQMPIKTLVIKV